MKRYTYSLDVLTPVLAAEFAEPVESDLALLSTISQNCSAGVLKSDTLSGCPAPLARDYSNVRKNMALHFTET